MMVATHSSECDSLVRPKIVPSFAVYFTHINWYVFHQVHSDDLHLSIASRQSKRPHRLPERYRDILPEPLPVSPSNCELIVQEEETPPNPASSSADRTPSLSAEASIPRQAAQFFRTPTNIFGLFRLFHSDVPPTHDPEGYLSDQDIVEQEQEPVMLPAPLAVEKEAHIFYPYPNRSSFLLGEWYWNQDAQKSREDFRQLLHIIVDPEFYADDVRQTKWRDIDNQLVGGPSDRRSRGDNKDDAEWFDEDAGWKITPITISIPFHSKSHRPGPRDFYVGDLHHRSLVSVIREKLTNEDDLKYFHYEPFELHWQPTPSAADQRVYGELYTSPTFLEAYHHLQESPREPGCELPRVVVALMFWSDATTLTNLGTSSSWPCYMFFGNESKYRRSSPKSKLCNHITFFHEVYTLICFINMSNQGHSFQMHSK